MSFITKDFMLHNEVSRKLYHEISAKQRIIDYHCHLDPKMIAENKPFNDIVEIWLLGDHYKWRAMRSNGIEEKYITGDASYKEKFRAWASTVENAVANPLFHWSALELKRYFDIDEILTEDNYELIYEKANAYIKKMNYTPKKLIEMSNVDYICTTDSPIDDLNYHDEIKKDKNFKTLVVPGFRPDILFNINENFYTFLNKLEEKTNIKIDSFANLIKALEDRIDFFKSKGSLVSDHGLSALHFENYTLSEIEDIFTKILNKGEIDEIKKAKYITALLVSLAKKYKNSGFVMQMHYGAIRNNDETIFNTIGPDAGCDSMMDQGNVAINLNRLLSLMKKNDGLPKFIVYNLEPSQNNMLATTIFNFSSGNKKGWLQYGSGWWFNDTKEGMLRQLKALSEQGLLMNFIGMLTDSRSLVSYIRHEYFRRILCEYVGDLVVKGEIPNDEKLLTKLIKNISYDNAKEYLELKGENK